MLVQDTQCSCGHSQAEEAERGVSLSMSNSYSIQWELCACVGGQSFTVIWFTAIVLVRLGGDSARILSTWEQYCLEVEIGNCLVKHGALYFKRNMTFYDISAMFLKLPWCYVLRNINARIYRGLIHVFGHLLVVTHLPSYFSTEKSQRSPSSFQSCFHISIENCLQHLSILVWETLCCYAETKIELRPSTHELSRQGQGE